MTLGIDNGTDGQTDGQTDRQTECDAICGPSYGGGPHNNYLSSSFNRGSVLQEKFNDFDSVFLARNVQRCETVLCANKLHLRTDHHQ